MRIRHLRSCTAEPVSRRRVFSLTNMKIYMLMSVSYAGGCNPRANIHNISLTNVGPVSCSECECAWGIDSVHVYSWDFKKQREVQIYTHSFDSDKFDQTDDIVLNNSTDLGPACWMASKMIPQYTFILNAQNTADAGTPTSELTELEMREVSIVRIEIVQGVHNFTSPYVLPLVQLQCFGSDESEPRIFPLSTGVNSIYPGASVTTRRNGTWQLSGWSDCSQACKPGIREADFECIDEMELPAVCMLQKPVRTEACNTDPPSENGFPIHENVAWSFRDHISKILYLIPLIYVVSFPISAVMLCWALRCNALARPAEGFKRSPLRLYGRRVRDVICNVSLHHISLLFAAAGFLGLLQMTRRRGGSLAAPYCGPIENDPKDHFSSIMWIGWTMIFHLLISWLASGMFTGKVRATTHGGPFESGVHSVLRYDRQKAFTFSSLRDMNKFGLLEKIETSRPIMVDVLTGVQHVAPKCFRSGFTQDQVGRALATHSNIFGLITVTVEGDWCEDDPDSVYLELDNTGIGADFISYETDYPERTALIAFTISSWTRRLLSKWYSIMALHMLLLGPVVCLWYYVTTAEVRLYFRKSTQTSSDYDEDDDDTFKQEIDALFKEIPFTSSGVSLTECNIGMSQIAQVKRWVSNAKMLRWRIYDRRYDDIEESDNANSLKKLLKRSHSTSPAEIQLPGICMEDEYITQPPAFRSLSAPSPSSPSKQSLVQGSELKDAQEWNKWSKEELKIDHLIDRAMEVLICGYAQFLTSQSPDGDEAFCSEEEAFQSILDTLGGIWHAGCFLRAEAKWSEILDRMRMHLRVQICQALARWEVDQVIELRESLNSFGMGREDLKLSALQCKLGSLRLETAIDAVELGNLRVQDHLAIAIIQAEQLSGGSALKVLPDDAQLSFTELLSRARSIYRERLYHDVQQIICSAAVKELLGDSSESSADMIIERLALADLSPDRSPCVRMAWQDLLESKSIIQQVQLLFDQTADKVITRDRRDDSVPVRLEVVRVKRSVNMDIYKPYFARRAAIAEVISESGDAGLRLQNARTVDVTGCWLDPVLMDSQGVWRDGDSGEMWMIRGNSALKLCEVLLHDEKKSITHPRNLGVLHVSSESEKDKHIIQWFHKGAIDSARKPPEVDCSPVDDVVPLVADQGTSASSLRDAAACAEKEVAWMGHFSPDGAIIWKCEGEDGSEVVICKWFRETALLGDWLIDNGHAAIAHKSTFEQAAALAGRSRWLAKELSAMDKMVKASDSKPDLVMLICQEFHPIWLESADAFYSANFRGSINDDGRQLELCFSAAEDGADSVPKTDGHSATKWAFRKVASARLSDQPLKAKAQELWLFHGTREYAAERIMDQDFTLKLTGSHRGSMFGPGIYLADSVTKSDEYTEEDWDGLRTMLICRCVMGRTLEQDAMRIHGHDCMRACLRNGHHSTLGRRAYDEYVVYDENQVYPEFLVWYRRRMKD